MKNPPISIHDKIAKDAHVEGSKLECQTCKKTLKLNQRQFSHYLAVGWPKCCGYTMRLITGREK